LFDGWSLGVLFEHWFNDYLTLLEGGAPALEINRFEPFAAYVRAHGDDPEAQAFWADYLRGAPVNQRLPLSAAPDAAPQMVAPMLDLPAWLGRAPDWRAEVAPMEDAMTRPLAPSRPDGAEFGEVPAARSPLELLAGRPKPVRAQAMRRGTRSHRLLQL